MVYIGVDPGKSGGVAVLTIEDNKATLDLYDVPDSEVDAVAIFEKIVKERGRAVQAVVENVHAFPSQGVSSMFTFGYWYGLVIAAMIANKIPFEKITPRKWIDSVVARTKGTMDKASWKKYLRDFAKVKFPYYAPKINLKNCDAVLLALYCRNVTSSRIEEMSVPVLPEQSNLPF